MPKLGCEGIYRGEVLATDLKEMDSGALACMISVMATEQLIGGKWAQFTDDKGDPEGWEARGDIWIIKKDGKPNENGVKQLVESLGWDRNLETIVDPDWNPMPCQITVKAESRSGNTYYNIAWLNPYDYEGPAGGSRGIGQDKSRVKALASKHGASLRALRLDVEPASKANPEGKGPQPDDKLPF